MGKKRILIVAGGTGGHVYPALSLARSLKKNDFEVYTAGRPRSFEEEIFNKEGFVFFPFTSYPLVRNYFTLEHLKTFFFNIKGMFQLYFFIISKEIEKIVCFGGYFSIPAVLASFLSGIPYYIHEQNYYPGVANRIFSRWAEKVFLSYPQSQKFFPSNVSCMLSGNLIRFSRKEIPILEFSYPLKILVVGGSLGARLLNDVIVDFLNNYREDKELLWEFTLITGKRFFEEYKQKLANKMGIKVLPYVEDMVSMYKSHHVVICRGGATTLWELLVARKPALIIPGDFATDDHQFKNALFLEEAGGAKVLREANFNRETLQNFLQLLDKKMYLQMVGNLDKIEVESGTEEILKVFEG